VIAKRLNIKGRHDMKKAELISAILSKESEKVADEEVDEDEEDVDTENENKDEAAITECKGKESYINDIEKGSLLAFKLPNKKVLSGKVLNVKDDTLYMETKNGKKYQIQKKDIFWVKTGERWPRGVYKLLKGEEVLADECERTNKANI
jgi:hypothetical protein